MCAAAGCRRCVQPRAAVDVCSRGLHTQDVGLAGIDVCSRGLHTQDVGLAGIDVYSRGLP